MANYRKKMCVVLLLLEFFVHFMYDIKIVKFLMYYSGFWGRNYNFFFFTINIGGFNLAIVCLLCVQLSIG